jgi:sirohydrochlorin cobaltochelatase
MPSRKSKAVSTPSRTLVLLAHGSRTRKSLEEMRELAESLQKKTHGLKVVGAFLEIARPSLPQAVAAAARSGSQEIHVLPLFLFTGKHAGDDVPALVDALRVKHSGLKLTLLPPLGRHPGLLDLLKQAAGFH